MAAEDGDAASRHDGPVLLFDGVCGLCHGTVRVILSIDRRGSLRFAPLTGEVARGVLDRHPEIAEVDSLVLVEHVGDRAREHVRVKSDAVLALARGLGGAWRLLGLLAVLPRPLRDWAYDLVARHRYRLFGRFDAPRPPPAAAAQRFLP